MHVPLDPTFRTDDRPDALALSLIIPAHNEEERLGHTLDRYGAAFRQRYGANFEVIVVANGCTDKTPQLVREASVTFPQLRLVDMPEASGKGGAVLEGFRQARGARIVFADADAATATESLFALIDDLDHDDISIGSRHLPGSVIERAAATPTSIRPDLQLGRGGALRPPVSRHTMRGESLPPRGGTATRLGRARAALGLRCGSPARGGSAQPHRCRIARRVGRPARLAPPDHDHDAGDHPLVMAHARATERGLTARYQRGARRARQSDRRSAAILARPHARLLAADPFFTASTARRE